MNIETKSLPVFLAIFLLLGACGQSGPLYLPGQSSTIDSMMPGQQPATAEESDEDDDEEQTDNIN